MNKLYKTKVSFIYVPFFLFWIFFLIYLTILAKKIVPSTTPVAAVITKGVQESCHLCS